MCLRLSSENYLYIPPEYVTAKKSKGEVLLFQKGRAPTFLTASKSTDLEAGGSPLAAEIAKGGKEKTHDVSAIARQTAIFSWQDVTYEFVPSLSNYPFVQHPGFTNSAFTCDRSIKIKGWFCRFMG